MSVATRRAISWRDSFLNIVLSLHFDDPLDEDTWGVDMFRRQLAQFHNTVHLRDGYRGRHGHHGPKIAAGVAVGQITPPVPELRLDEGKISFKGLFQHIAHTIKNP